MEWCAVAELVTTCRHCRRAETRHGKDASNAGTLRGANQNWYGVADRLPFMACPGAQKSPNRLCDSPSPPELLSWWCDVTWVIMEPAAGSFSHCTVPTIDPGIVRSFAVSPEGCTPSRGGSAKCAKCGNRSQELNPGPAMSPRRHGPRLARRSSRVHRAFPAALVDSSLA
jgi:hypothetical protein